MKHLSLLMVCALIFSACQTNSSATYKETKDFSRVDDPSSSQTLVDHLRGVPGISVDGDGAGAKVKIRGVSSLYGNNEPLFVVNGQALSGGLREAVQIIPVATIKSIRVLKTPSETGMYGVRGANGVIVIQLR